MVELIIWEGLDSSTNSPGPKAYAHYVARIIPEEYPICCKSITYPCKDVRPLISQEHC
jgi:hypothetical protein